MDIRELLIAYKIALKEDKELNIFSFDNMLPYRAKLVCGLVGVLCFYFASLYSDMIGWSAIFGLSFALCAYALLQSRKTNNLKDTEKLFSDNDIKRINLVVRLLEQFEIEWKNDHVMDLLIDELGKERKENYLLELFVKGRVIFVALIVVWYNAFVNKAVEKNMDVDIIGITFLLGLYSMVAYIVWTNLVDLCLFLFTPDYFAYQDFIHDLRQVRIFRSKIELMKDGMY